MTLYLTPELGPPVPTTGAKEPLYDLPDRVAAASKTIEFLVPYGLEVVPGRDDKTVAAAAITAYAANPESASKLHSQKRISKMTPASLRHLDKMLKDFSHKVVEDSTQLRRYVTNKLVEESDNPDARIRIRALELLGKISDVGLFADKTEVTVTHQTTEDLRVTLREKLSRLTNNSDVIEAEIVESDAPPVQHIDSGSILSAWDDDDDE